RLLFGFLKKMSSYRPSYGGGTQQACGTLTGLTWATSMPYGKIWTPRDGRTYDVRSRTESRSSMVLRLVIYFLWLKVRIRDRTEMCTLEMLHFGITKC